MDKETQFPNLLDLFKNGKNQLDIHDANVKPLQKKIELKKKIPPPEPSALKLIIITCKTFLNCNLNLDLIARKLEIGEQIKGKKLLGVAEEGSIKTKSKNYTMNKNKRIKKKKQNSIREDFSNQCTVIVKPNGYEKLINLKLFANGKMVITGGMTKETGKCAVNVLKNAIRNLEDDYQISRETSFSNLFEDVISYVKYMNKNYLVFLKLFELYGIKIDLKLDLILNKKLISMYPMIDMSTGKYIEKDLRTCSLSELISNAVIMSGSEEDLKNYLRIIGVFNICRLYFPNVVLLDKLNDVGDNTHKIISNLYNFEKERLPVTFDKEALDRDFEVTIENYNTMFNIGFHLDREMFTQILDNQYKIQKLISSAKFEPSYYQGINAKYISRILCKQDCSSLGKKKTSKCPCKEISFLIFQEGNVIITGGRSWEQITDGYNVISKIMRDEYYTIMVEKQKETCEEIINLPPQIIKQTDDDEKIVYLNKKQQIIENPRNYYILKQLGLLDKYF